MANDPTVTYKIRMAAIEAAAKVNQPTGSYRPPDQIIKATIEIAAEFERYIYHGAG